MDLPEHADILITPTRPQNLPVWGGEGGELGDVNERLKSGFDGSSE